MSKAVIKNGTYKITNKITNGQRKQLKKLLKIVTTIENECANDKIFDQFIKELYVFDFIASQDLSEIKSILADNIDRPFM